MVSIAPVERPPESLDELGSYIAKLNITDVEILRTYDKLKMCAADYDTHKYTGTIAVGACTGVGLHSYYNLYTDNKYEYICNVAKWVGAGLGLYTVTNMYTVSSTYNKLHKKLTKMLRDYVTSTNLDMYNTHVNSQVDRVLCGNLADASSRARETLQELMFMLRRVSSIEINKIPNTNQATIAAIDFDMSKYYPDWVKPQTYTHHVERISQVKAAILAEMEYCCMLIDAKHPPTYTPSMYSADFKI